MNRKIPLSSDSGRSPCLPPPTGKHISCGAILISDRLFEHPACGGIAIEARTRRFEMKTVRSRLSFEAQRQASVAREGHSPSRCARPHRRRRRLRPLEPARREKHRDPVAARSLRPDEPGRSGADRRASRSRQDLALSRTDRRSHEIGRARRLLQPGGLARRYREELPDYRRRLGGFHPLFDFDSSDAISADHIMSKQASARRGTFVVVDYLQLLDQKREKPALMIQVQALRSFAQARG